MLRPSFILLPAALLLIQGCASSEEYRARTSSETARAVNTPSASESAPSGNAPAPANRPLSLMHRSKPYAYSTEAGGLTLAADASQAHLQLEGKDGYLPLGVVIANRSKVDLLLTTQSFSYRKGDDGEWQPLPSYEEVRRTTFPSSTVRRQLYENDAFSTRVAYSAMRHVRFGPYPDTSNIRVDNIALPTLSYGWFTLYIPNPGMAGAAGNHYLRYTDSERHAEIILAFPLSEAKH